MDLNRSNVRAREWIERNWLPKGWVIAQDGTGKYIKVDDGTSYTIFHGASWAHVVGFCEGVAAGRTHEKRQYEEQQRAEHHARGEEYRP